jgi:hypothetical protein
MLRTAFETAMPGRSLRAAYLQRGPRAIHRCDDFVVTAMPTVGGSKRVSLVPTAPLSGALIASSESAEDTPSRESSSSRDDRRTCKRRCERFATSRPQRAAGGSWSVGIPTRWRYNATARLTEEDSFPAMSRLAFRPTRTMP